MLHHEGPWQILVLLSHTSPEPLTNKFLFAINHPVFTILLEQPKVVGDATQGWQGSELGSAKLTTSYTLQTPLAAHRHLLYLKDSDRG